MNITEIVVYIAPIGTFVALYVAVKTEVLRRKSEQDTIKVNIRNLQSDVEMLKIRMSPFFTVMEQKLSDLFHSDNDTWRIDYIVEKYKNDPDTLNDHELDILISVISKWYDRVKKGGPEEDTSYAIATSIYHAILLGRRDVRRLKQYPDVVIEKPKEDSWLLEFWKFLVGYKSPPK